MEELAELALDAAVGSGAGYADARVVTRRAQYVSTKNGQVDSVADAESEGIGVRVLVDGAWGFACDRRLSRRGRPGRRPARGRIRAGERRRAPHGASSSLRSRAETGEFATPIEQRPDRGAARARRSSSACAPRRGCAAPRSRSPRRACAPCGRQRCVPLLRGRATSSRSSSSAAAGSTPWRSPTTGGCRSGATRARTAARAAQAGWEYVEGLGLEREAPRVGEEAAALLDGRSVPVDGDDRRRRRRADAAPGARVGRPSDRARPRLRDRGGLRRHELPEARRPGQPPLRLGAHEHHRRPDDAPRPRHLRVRRRGRAGAPTPGRRGRDPDRLPLLPRDRGAHRPGSRRLDARGRLEPDAARPDDEPPSRAGRRVRSTTCSRTSTTASTSRRTRAGRSTTSASTSSSERRSRGRSSAESSAKMLRDATYMGVTPDFWGSLDAVAGPEEWRLHGLTNCGKGQPGQHAHVSHGASPARFRERPGGRRRGEPVSAGRSSSPTAPAEPPRATRQTRSLRSSARASPASPAPRYTSRR